MAPASKRKCKGKADTAGEDPTTSKPVPKGDASDTTAFEFEPQVAIRRLRHTDSEMSSTETEKMANNSGKGSGKRLKLASPMSKRAAGNLPGRVASSSTSTKVRILNQTVVSAKDITQEMMEAVLVDGVDPILGRRFLENAARFEALVFNLMAENEKLNGRQEVLEAVQCTFKVSAVPAVVSRSASASRSVPAVPANTAAVATAANLPKPMETWSVVVKGKKGVTSKEVVEKVVKEVGPTLGVRVHELRPLRRSDGAVIRTTSVAERDKVAASEKFGEVGLELSVNDKLGPKVVVQRAHPEITPDEFMGELYDLNFRRRMTPEEFKRSRV
ncbi:putative 50 kDa protein in type I retrotransposable element R1DM [Lucilia cuprina]|nr:putative 50 kDa protein in type I retrotransposable element R1DM [Lucilia cuprina]